MSERLKVPAALHAELTEYSSLLRALRTSSTLDLTSHLTEFPASIQQTTIPDDESLIEDDGERGTNEPPIAGSVSQGLASEVGSSGQSHGGSTLERHAGKAKRKDTWTRWPLLAGDVHVPEWGLVDEVKLIAEKVLATSRSPGPDTNDKDDVEDDLSSVCVSDAATTPTSLVDDYDHPALTSLGLQALTADSAAFLTRILALLAAYIPSGDKSMQNRVRPIAWETVLDIACANGTTSPRSVEVIRERMARLYPQSQSFAVHRANHLHSINEGLVRALHKHDDSLLAHPNRCVLLEKPARRKRGPYKRRQVSTETDAGPSIKRQRSEDG